MLSITADNAASTTLEMNLLFAKYQGTGNDFVMIDNRSGEWDNLSVPAIQTICDRRFGVGADGLIKISAHPNLDFEMDYYNADGSKSFCGNGARCSVAFAQSLGMNTLNTHFMAIDGEHEANQKEEAIALLIKDVSLVEMAGQDYLIHTGSPHYIRFVEEVAVVNVLEEGRAVRYAERYAEEGINVNFVAEAGHEKIGVRTYERGVEDETLSCGTGVTAAALAYALKNDLRGQQLIDVATKGGPLKVDFSRTGESEFERIYLIGPAERVFEGQIQL